MCAWSNVLGVFQHMYTIIWLLQGNALDAQNTLYRILDLTCEVAMLSSILIVKDQLVRFLLGLWYPP